MTTQFNGLKPTQSLNPKIKNVWRITAAIWLVLAFLVTTLPLIIFAIAEPYIPEIKIVATVFLAIIVVLAIVWLFAIIPFRYARFKYELFEDFLVISKGVIWRKQYVIPFIRVQNTDTKQGPILRACHLASVTVSTAAGAHEIPGLVTELAEQLRDKAAELARIAREDV